MIFKQNLEATSVLFGPVGGDDNQHTLIIAPGLLVNKISFVCSPAKNLARGLIQTGSK